MRAALRLSGGAAGGEPAAWCLQLVQTLNNGKRSITGQAHLRAFKRSIWGQGYVRAFVSERSCAGLGGWGAVGGAVPSRCVGLGRGRCLSRAEGEAEYGAGSLSYIVRTRGRGVVQGNLILTDREEGRTMDSLRASGKADDEIVMMKGSRLSGRLWISKGRPAKDLSVRLDMSMPLGPEVISEGQPLKVKTDSQGRFSFESCNRGFAYRLSCYIQPTSVPLARVGPDYPLQGLVLLAQDISGFGKDTVLDDIYLDQMSFLRVEVRDANGRPVFAPMLHVVDAKSAFGEKGSIPDSLVYVGSGRGRLSILWPEAVDRSLLVAISPRSEGFLAIPKALPKEPLAITLQPSTWIRGTVVDDEGKPLAGARISISVSPQSGDPPRFDYPSSGSPLKADAEGRFAVEVCTHRKYTIMAGRPGLGAMYRVASMKDVDVDAKPIEDLEITIPKAR